MLEELLSEELLSAMDSDSDDEVLLQASNVYETSQSMPVPVPTPTTRTLVPVTTSPTSLPSGSKSISRLAPPKLEEEILEERKTGIPKKTLQDAKYCINIIMGGMEKTQNAVH